MFSIRTNSVLVLVLLSGSICIAQEKPVSVLFLKVDETVRGPVGGETSSSCLRVYSDGRVLYARWWNSAAIIVDKESGKQSRPEHTVSAEHHLPDTDMWELTHFLTSKSVKRLAAKFDPPHPPIDYVELVSLQIIDPKGKGKIISTREFFVADLEEKSKYPSALIVLMEKIDEIEKEANEKGKAVDVPSDCHLEPKGK